MQQIREEQVEPGGDGGEKEGSGIFGSVYESESCFYFVIFTFLSYDFVSA